MLLESSPDGTLRGVLPYQKVTPKTSDEPAASAASDVVPATAATDLKKATKRRVGSPAAVGWIVASLILVVALLMVFRGSPDDSATTGDAGNQSAQAPSPFPNGTNPPQHTVVDPQTGQLIETRLAELGGWITDYREQLQQFPSAPAANGELPLAERFGWIATLRAETNPDDLQPLWDRAWNDPLNDRFVRQRIDLLLNPAAPRMTGESGYPATHFAGIAGVGADGPSLPKNHGRAGIFGFDRVTRAADVVDGLASTMMAAGVQSEIESWAASGRATIRPFVEEPYINGPDGFGTRQPDGMYVLMADGSVRFLANNTDPRLIRRMAAMADRLPLDATVPGEPGDESQAPVPIADAMPAEEDDPDLAASEQDGDDEPIAVEMAPDEPLFDVDAALGQRIVEFTQEDPVPAAALLLQIEELAGVPIDAGPVFEAGEADLLERPVSLALVETTVEGVLAAVLDQAGLSYTKGPGGIALLIADEEESP